MHTDTAVTLPGYYDVPCAAPAQQEKAHGKEQECVQCVVAGGTHMPWNEVNYRLETSCVACVLALPHLTYCCRCITSTSAASHQRLLFMFLCTLSQEAVAADAKQPAYVKDDFFDAFANDAMGGHTRDNTQNWHAKLLEQKRIDMETFGGLGTARHQGYGRGRGGHGGHGGHTGGRGAPGGGHGYQGGGRGGGQGGGRVSTATHDSNRLSWVFVFVLDERDGEHDLLYLLFSAFIARINLMSYDLMHGEDAEDALAARTGPLSYICPDWPWDMLDQRLLLSLE